MRDVQKFKPCLFISVIMIFSCMSLQALRVELLSNLNDMLLSRKIALHFFLESSDDALYKDFFSFSVDSSEIQLKNWKISTSDFLEYISSFKHEMLVYRESFRVDLSFSFIDYDYRYDDHVKMIDILKKSHIFISCIILGKNKKNRSKSMMIKLDTLEANENVPQEPKPLIKEDQVTMKKSVNEVIDYCLHEHKENEEFFWINCFLQEVYFFLIRAIHFLSKQFFYLECLLVFFLFLILLFIGITKYFFRKTNILKLLFSLGDGLLFLFIFLNLNILYFVITSYRILLWYALFCFLCGFYLSIKKNSNRKIFNRALGIDLLILVIPLLLKALFVQISSL